MYLLCYLNYFIHKDLHKMTDTILDKILKKIYVYIVDHDYKSIEYMIQRAREPLKTQIIDYIVKISSLQDKVDAIKFLIENKHIEPDYKNNIIIKVSSVVYYDTKTITDVVKYIIEFKDVDISVNNNILLDTAVELHDRKFIDKLMKDSRIVFTEDNILVSMFYEEVDVALKILDRTQNITSSEILYRAVEDNTLKDILNFLIDNRRDYVEQHINQVLVRLLTIDTHSIQPIDQIHIIEIMNTMKDKLQLDITFDDYLLLKTANISNLTDVIVYLLCSYSDLDIDYNLFLENGYLSHKNKRFILLCYDIRDILETVEKKEFNINTEIEDDKKFLNYLIDTKPFDREYITEMFDYIPETTVVSILSEIIPENLNYLGKIVGEYSGYS